VAADKDALCTSSRMWAHSVQTLFFNFLIFPHTN
jgi:hypothetical protein